MGFWQPASMADQGVQKEKLRVKSKKAVSHAFTGYYDRGQSRIMCVFKSKRTGLRVMAMLHERLSFCKYHSGNELDGRVYYFTIPKGDIIDRDLKFVFEDVRNREQVDKEIVETSVAMVDQISRRYHELQSVFDDEVRNAILGGGYFF